MATTQTPQKSQSLPTNTNHKVEPVKAPETTTTAASAETANTAAPVETPKTDSPKGTTVISITVDERLARQARFLARARGCSISSLFTDAASIAIPVALKAALADLQGDLE